MNTASRPFQPPRGLGNPHLQTILSSMGRKLWPTRAQQQFQADAERVTIETAGVKLCVDLNIERGRPLVLLIPGWLGNSQSAYALACGSALSRAGFSVARFNLRDHGNTAHLNEGLFNSAMIDEVVSLARVLDGRHGQGRSGLLGFSLGGNFALRVAKALPSLSTLAVCPAIAPADTVSAIDRNPLYQRYFINKWRKTWLAKQAAFPARYDFTHALRLNTVAALTDYFVKYHSDFASTASYFAAYDLQGGTLAGVTANILATHDDPIIPRSQYDHLPPSLTVDLIEQGGHHAFIDSWRLHSWFDGYAIDFFKASLD